MHAHSTESSEIFHPSAQMSILPKKMSVLGTMSTNGILKSALAGFRNVRSGLTILDFPRRSIKGGKFSVGILVT